MRSLRCKSGESDILYLGSSRNQSGEQWSHKQSAGRSQQDKQQLWGAGVGIVGDLHLHPTSGLRVEGRLPV